jgi:flavin-dependent thymidylate synthase
MAEDTNRHDWNMPHAFDENGDVTECPPNCPALTGSQVVRWADRAMFRAEPDPEALAGEEVTPRVVLISMTPDPLRVMAAAAEMYKGHVARSGDVIDQNTALFWWDEMTKTKLHAPLEFIDLHFMIEGVTRAFTHQLVRQRTAVYVQESLRFAVKENASLEVAMPPSIACLREDAPARVIWDSMVQRIGAAYNALIDNGIPAEDARGILPTNITTRVHYKTNLRNLAEHAGLRLCSQAQYEWKVVWNEMIRAIREYGPPQNRWQQREIVGLFKPVCYQTGKCEFNGANDRWCVIRDRVQAHAAQGDPPKVWLDINPLDPLLHGAAIQKPE